MNKTLSGVLVFVAVILMLGISAPVNSPLMLDEDDMVSDDNTCTVTQQSVKAYSDSGTQTMTNKTLTSPVINTGVSGTAFLDEDNMASDSATKFASQQSIKKYVDDNLGTQMVVVVDEKTAATDGGGFTQDAWQTRTLNTLQVNDDTIASLSSNQITLPAGTYECWISAPALGVNAHKIRLQDTTGASTIDFGSSEYASATHVVQSRSVLRTKFTLTVSSALEVQHRGQTTKADNGFGNNTNFSVVEVYTIAMFRKMN